MPFDAREKTAFDFAARFPLIRSTQHTPCKICQGHAVLFDVVDFNKFCSDVDFYAFGLSGVQVPYFRCLDCLFIFTRFFDDWTGEQFADHIYNADYVKVDGDYLGARPERLAAAAAGMLRPNDSLRILDYGSGSGIFVRAMRERGFENIEGYDPFSSPERPTGLFNVITCCEVLEHSGDPGETLQDIMSFLAPGGILAFTTALQPSDIDKLRANWWYVAPRNGHISIYSREALTMLALQHGMTFFSGHGFHFFAPDAETLRHLVNGSPASQMAFVLKAPAEGCDESWWGTEGNPSSRRFRWTRTNLLHWDIPPAEENVLVRIPYINQIEPGFAEGCRIISASQTVPVRLESGALIAETAMTDQSGVFLETPELASPNALRGISDNRMIGLAITI